MNRHEFLKTLDEEAKKQFIKDMEDNGIRKTARDYRITYGQAAALSKDLNIKFNSYKMNKRKTRDLSNHFKMLRDVKAKIL